jgi:hypothetical protein
VDNTKLTITEKVVTASAAILPNLQFTAVLSPATVADNTKTSAGLPVFAGPTLGDGATKTFTINSTSTVVCDEGSDEYYTSDAKTFDLSGLTFTKAGVYRYELTVTNTGDQAANYSTYISEQGSDPKSLDTVHKYQVDVYVTKSGSTASIAAVVMNVMSSATADGVTTWSVTDTKFDGTITHVMSFDQLVIVNHVEGKYADPTDGTEFTFYVNIPAGGDNLDLLDTTKIPYTFTDIDGVEHTKDANGNDLYIQVAGSPKASDSDYYQNGTNNEITLKAGEFITLTQLPEGMIYNVKEKDPTTCDNNDYTFTWSSWTTKTTAADGGSADTTIKYENTPTTAISLSKTIVDGGNRLDFYNTLTLDNAPTGITLEVLPYAMIAALAVAGGVLLISKKRKFDR